MNEKEFFERQGRIQREITVERYRQLNKSTIKGQILFAGSSLAEQFPMNEMLLRRDMPYQVYNRGVSGDTMEGLTKDIQTLVLDLAPSKLFINIGSNDIGGVVYDENGLYNNYCILLETIAKALPACKFHVLSYYPVNPSKASFLDAMAKKFLFANRTNENVDRMNQLLEAYCQDHHITYINVHDILLDSEGNLDEVLTVEGIHLWPAAYERILEVLLPFF